MKKSLAIVGWAMGTISNCIVLGAVLLDYVLPWALLFAVVNEIVLSAYFVNVVTPATAPGLRHSISQMAHYLKTDREVVEVPHTVLRGWMGVMEDEA